MSSECSGVMIQSGKTSRNIDSSWHFSIKIQYIIVDHCQLKCFVKLATLINSMALINDLWKHKQEISLTTGCREFRYLNLTQTQQLEAFSISKIIVIKLVFIMVEFFSLTKSSWSLSLTEFWWGILRISMKYPWFCLI